MRLPWNQPVDLPRDLLPVIPLALGFAVVHALLKQHVFYPLAQKYLQDPKAARDKPKTHQRKPSSSSPTFHGDEMDMPEKTMSNKERRLKKKQEDEDAGLLDEKFAIAAWNFCCHSFLLYVSPTGYSAGEMEAKPSAE